MSSVENPKAGQVLYLITWKDKNVDVPGHDVLIYSVSGKFVQFWVIRTFRENDQEPGDKELTAMTDVKYRSKDFVNLNRSLGYEAKGGENKSILRLKKLKDTQQSIFCTIISMIPQEQHQGPSMCG